MEVIVKDLSDPVCLFNEEINHILCVWSQFVTYSIATVFAVWIEVSIQMIEG